MNQPYSEKDFDGLEARSPVDAPVIEVYGFLNSAIGLGETARLLVESLRAAGCAARPVAVPLKGRKRIGYTPNELPAFQPTGDAVVRVLHLNPEHMVEMLPMVSDDFFTSSRTVLVPYWETEEIPEEAKPYARLFDEVWCTTSFLAGAFGRGFGLPLRVFPAPLATPRAADMERQERYGFDDRYVFLFSFDYHSCFKRKNPDGVCEAFVRAFPEQAPGGPLLVIKSIHGQEHFSQYIYLQILYSGRRDIFFIDGYLPENERNALVHRCNAYVSLHRSEGLGMTILEAMVQGKPCIATAYAGNVDFTLEGHSYPIPFKKCRIGPGSIHYPENQEWAEPDLDAAAGAMRECFTNQDAALGKGEMARAWVAENHSFGRVGGILVGFLDDLVSRPYDGAEKKRRLDELAAREPLIQEGHAGKSYKALKEARERVRCAEVLLDALPQKHQKLEDICRQLAHSNKLLASAISSSIKLGKGRAEAAARAAAIKEHSEQMLMRAILDKLRR